MRSCMPATRSVLRFEILDETAKGKVSPCLSLVLNCELPKVIDLF